MDVFPFDYVPIPPTTWAYLSSFLLLALFFKFNRFWSVRNLDLLLIILLAPGLLLIDAGRRWVVEYDAEQARVVLQINQAKTAAAENGKSEKADLEKLRNGTGDSDAAKGGDKKPSYDAVNKAGEKRASDYTSQISDGNRKLEDKTGLMSDGSEKKTPIRLTKGHHWQRWGYYWLFGVGVILMFRMLFDSNLKRRPNLEPNLSIGGLVFFGCALMAFLFANIISSNPAVDDLRGAENAVKLVQRTAAEDSDAQQLVRRGPGYWLFNLLPIIPSFETGDEMLTADTNLMPNMSRYVIAAKSLAIASQVAIVFGLILFCFFNYKNFNVGVGTATIYLMLPYTAIYTGHVLHVLPAALMIWAMVSFRRPLLSGVLVGLATGVSYYPIFLLPLWISFYWDKGKSRFLIGVAIAILVCIGGLIFTSVDVEMFGNQLQTMFGFWRPMMEGLEGIWALGWNQWWRLPILVAFVSLCISFAAWPLEKNIGTLVSCSAAVMVGVQFWHGFGGGLYMAWYLPMVLLAFFRPNLAGRVAALELVEVAKPAKETPEDFLSGV